jgi:ubiquinone/menaquinone biosynthesis C-methylase UbiE
MGFSSRSQAILRMTTTPPVCDYEGSDYQRSFWDQGGRKYEDLSEAIALQRLLPKTGHWMLELGAGAGRNTPRYSGFEHVVLLDYSLTQLEQAQHRLGNSHQFVFVAADIYRLPFRDRIFDAATMIRTLHHMADAPRALERVRKALCPGAVFILEYANKKNLKSILRYWLGRQEWNPFSLDAVEFVKLNFDFHPRAVRTWLEELGFSVEKVRTVSHFRINLLKRLFPPQVLAALDGLFQPTGALVQFTPSVFLRARLKSTASPQEYPRSAMDLFACPDCSSKDLVDGGDHLICKGCSAHWIFRNGVYDFRLKK